MRRHPVYLVSWLLAAAVLFSLAGLTAEPVPADVVGADHLIEVGRHS